jgi:hypothetical protein
MTNYMHFPKNNITKTDTGYEAVGGLQLKSILKADLLEVRRDVNEQKKDIPLEQTYAYHFHQLRAAFIQAISAWPEHICLEIHIVCVPNLRYRLQGNITIALIMRVSGATQEVVQEEFLSRYLMLTVLLHAHLSEAEFTPIFQDTELLKRLSPFSHTNALAIHRREKQIVLSTPIKRRSIGLGLGQLKMEEKGTFIRHRFPWVPSYDDWSKLMDTLMGMLDPVHIILRLSKTKLLRLQKEQMEETIRHCESFLKTGEPYQLSLNMQVSLIRDITVKHLLELTDQAFHIGVFLLAQHPIDHSLGHVLGQAITDTKSTSDNMQGLFQGGFMVTDVRVEDAVHGNYFCDEGAYSVHEAACAFRLPAPPATEQSGLPLRKSRTAFALLPPEREEKPPCSIQLCINEHHNMMQPVKLSMDDRMRHMFIIGQTGTGKSTFMESMILDDIRHGRGVAVIDPHGDMVASILGKIPKGRQGEVVFFNLLDRERPLGFNLIDWKSIEERDLIIDEMYNTLDRIYDMKETGGPIFESNFRGMLKLLMGDKKDEAFIPTLLDFVQCYTSKDFRKWLKNRISDPVVLDFVRELERTGGDASLHNLSPYITSKFSRFVHDTTLMHIIGQEKTTFDFEEIINQGQILLVNLGRGRFGSIVSALLANQIVARFKHAAMNRGGMKPENRREFYLYVDECHSLPTDTFTELLAEARKFRMGLILSCQYTAQLNGNGARNNLLAAIIGNVGTMILFRLGQEDAKLMAPVIQPNFSHLDIIGLPNWQGYSRVQMAGSSVPPFSFKSVKDDTLYDSTGAAWIREQSRLKYGMDAMNVDEQIIRRRRSWQTEEKIND